MKIIEFIKTLFKEKVCCGDRQCDKYNYCIDNSSIAAIKCPYRKIDLLTPLDNTYLGERERDV